MLKNILRLLLSRFYSKNESALVARQSLPDTSEYVDWSSSAVVGKQGTYICPDDGYVVIAAKSGSNTGVNVWGSLDIGVAGASGIQPKVFCPCRKGRVINYIITGELHLTRFYKFIGGGYKTIKLLLQGGGLCLSHWFSSLRRSSCRVNERVFRTGRILKLIRILLSICLALLLRAKNLHMFLQRMEFFRLLSEKHPCRGCKHPLKGVWHRNYLGRFILRSTLGLFIRSQLKRAIALNFPVRRSILNLTCFLSPISRKYWRIGGAL